jgi:hypothetical protein
MKLASQFIAYLSSALTLLTTNLLFSLPAQAAITCSPGTIQNYQNGSLASCILENDTQIQLSNSKAGTLNISCKAKNYILFHSDGNFKSCQINQNITITKNNSVEVCPAESTLEVEIFQDGNLSMSCQKLGY